MRDVILMIFALGGVALVGVTLLARRRATRPDDESRVPSLGDLAAFVMSYQVTMNIADTREEAHAGINSYITQYYPELSKAMDLREWGPIGTPEDVIDWLNTFAAAGVDYFICRFGSLDQFGQVERLARDVLPAFETHLTASV